MLNPASEEELAQTLAKPNTYKPVGSGTSKSPCFETTGSSLSVRAWKQIEALPNNCVRVGAGVVLSELLAFLRQHNLALPTIGEWDGQTMGGAISTGTHGGSYSHGSLCTSVREVTFLDGTGTLHTLKQNDPDFAHVLPSFGTTGVVIGYVLQCEPRFYLAVGRSSWSMNDYVPRLLENPRNVEFRSAIWLPALDTVIDYSASRISPTDVVPRQKRFNNPAMIADWLSRKTSRGLRRVPNRFSRHGLFTRLFSRESYMGPYDEMLAPLKGTAQEILKKRARNRTPPEGEFAVPFHVAPRFIKELQKLYRRSGLAPDRPIGLRPGAVDTGTLSAIQGEPGIWISMFVAPDNPFAKQLPGLLQEMGARPHWGKCVFNEARTLAPLYPGWDDFCAFRRRMDPQNKFANSFTEYIGLTQTR